MSLRRTANREELLHVTGSVDRSAIPYDQQPAHKVPDHVLQEENTSGAAQRVLSCKLNQLPCEGQSAHRRKMIVGLANSQHSRLSARNSRLTFCNSGNHRSCSIGKRRIAPLRGRTSKPLSPRLFAAFTYLMTAALPTARASAISSCFQPSPMISKAQRRRTSGRSVQGCFDPYAHICIRLTFQCNDPEVYLIKG